MIKGLLSYGLSLMVEMKKRNEEWKERILKEWDESKNLPRKKKKAKRKELKVDWAVANWNILDF